MDRELSEQVMLERVEMIARLAASCMCQEKDREIALGMTADLVMEKLIESKDTHFINIITDE
ncbi:hypothetical protein AAEK50_003027 [Serratia marcescens]|uniref:hypothetical protein n=1 Tax=Serratia TaxID=613 RepID=UPI001A2B777C|nr:hypothetical protein [Serratia marcescens]HEI9729224.1 hypothetical protein [Serratia marcescens]HEI9759143.1 hypothetical protein [Serratia marcescens]HEJ6937472.1 hypothetical protein [Serratia marcescens]HEJ7844987.1 hypothetical protein [Serratia marcescens]